MGPGVPDPLSGLFSPLRREGYSSSSASNPEDENMGSIYHGETTGTMNKDILQLVEGIGEWLLWLLHPGTNEVKISLMKMRCKAGGDSGSGKII